MAAIATPQSAFFNRFRILTDLGGETGSVYAAEDLRTGRRVALRVVPDLSAQLSSLVLEQAAAASLVSHPIFADVIEWGQADGSVYVASELVDGTALDRWADEVGIPSLPTVVELVERLCVGLAAAHRQGIEHDALMPHNLRVLPFTFGHDDRLAVKVLDLGVPVLRSRPLLDAQRAQFLAPEQVVPVRGGWKSVTGIGELSAVYSAGAVLFFLCAGGRPYRVRDVHALEVARSQGELPKLHRINPRVPVAVTEIVSKAMALDPEARFASLEAMSEALRFGARTSRRPTTGSRRAAPALDPGIAEATGPVGSHGFGLPDGYVDVVNAAIAAVMPENHGHASPPTISAMRPSARLRPSRPAQPQPSAPDRSDSAAPMPPPTFGAANDDEAFDDEAFDAEIDAAIARTLEPGPSGAREALSSQRLVFGLRLRHALARLWRRLDAVVSRARDLLLRS